MAKLPIPFSNPKTYVGHSGVDYGQPSGTRIPASASGRITTRSYNAAGGYYVWVQYDSGPLVGYHHLQSHRGTPAPGSRVSEGSTLGYVGSTGNSTGPHLHSEVAGHRTTAGYWLFFDRNRVVGSAPAGGGGTPITPTTPTKRKKNDMLMIHRNKSGVARGVEYAVFGGGFWFPFTTGDAATSNGFADQVGANSVLVDNAFWDYCKAQAEAGQISATLVKAITDAVSSSVAVALKGANVSIDPAAVAKAVDTAVADNFAAIPDAVRKNLKDNL